MIPIYHKFHYHALFLLLLIAAAVSGCRSEAKPDATTEEDTAAKQRLQGTWVTESDGDILFTIKGDTLYYNDTQSAPAAFLVRHDSLVILNHTVVRYALKRLTDTELRFVNTEGDVVELTKSTDNTTAVTLQQGEYEGAISLNQGQRIKRDTVVFVGDKRLHAYTQVNPTSYKVYQQSTNSDGMTVENVYYDNLVFIAVYDGSRRVYGQNVKKADFASVVPKTYIDQAVLSDILIQGATAKGVRFTAILSIPDSYTNYRINIDITTEGKRELSI